MKKKPLIILLSALICILIAVVAYKIWTNNKNINSSIFHGENKNYISVGDSITFRDSKEENNVKILGYQTLMDKQIRFNTVKNFGISGASMAKPFDYPKNKSISIDDGKKDYSKTDLITIFAGTNDFRLDVPVGNIGKLNDKSFDISTFYGAYRALIENIKNQNPKVKIYLLTPIQRNNSGYSTTSVNKAGYKLIDYVNAVKSIGNLYKLPVIDLYSTSGITEDNVKAYTVDGLHPNNKGYQLVVKPILKVIQK